MMVRDIYAFHMDIGDNRLNETVPLWCSIWSKHGWTPHILGIRDAAKHPNFGRMWTKSESMPTVNDRLFSTVNFLRWCAFARVNGVITDYDVLPRVSFPPRDFRLPFSGDRDGGPGFMVGSCSDFERIVDLILGYHPKPEDNHLGQPHVCDMTILRQYHQKLYDGREDLIKCYGVSGWKTVPLVHFGNSYLDNGRSKRDQIHEILKQEGAFCE